MTEPIRLVLPIPPSLNGAYKNVPGRGRVSSVILTNWKRAAGWYLRSQRPGGISGPYRFSIYLPIGMRGDVSNRIKAAEDLLVKMRIVQDDSLSERIGMSWGPPGSDVRVILSKCERRS